MVDDTLFLIFNYISEVGIKKKHYICAVMEYAFFK